MKYKVLHVIRPEQHDSPNENRQSAYTLIDVYQKKEETLFNFFNRLFKGDWELIAGYKLYRAIKEDAKHFTTIEEVIKYLVQLDVTTGSSYMFWGPESTGY